MCRSPDAQPGAPGPTLLAFSTASYHQTPSGVPMISNSSDFLSTQSFIIVQSPTQSLEWHVWSSSSGNNCHTVQRSLSSGASVYECIMGFYLVHFCQPNPPTRFLSITGHWKVSLPSGASLWNGMYGRVEGQYTTLCSFNYLLLERFYTSVLADGLSLRVEWKQASSSLQDSSQYSGWSQYYCILDGLHSSSYFQVLQSL